MTTRNVANDSLWRSESHPRTTCYRRCPADPADRGAARFFGQRHRDYASSASDDMRWPVVG